jgi:hypothetical protein
LLRYSAVCAFPQGGIGATNGNGKWQMANGKWQMANGKWQMAMAMANVGTVLLLSQNYMLNS